LIELVILVLEFVTLLFRFGFFAGGVGQFSDDLLLARVACVQNRFVKKAPQQPHEDEEVERLRPDASGCWASAVSAVATERPSPRAGIIQPISVVRPAMTIEATAMSVMLSIGMSFIC
jgi:hypothetical protein